MHGAKFKLGVVVTTPAAADVMASSGQTPTEFLNRHVKGDWGDVCEEDWNLNDEALREGSRILSSYETILGERLWIITEWDRTITTILLPFEY